MQPLRKSRVLWRRRKVAARCFGALCFVHPAHPTQTRKSVDRPLPNDQLCEPWIADKLGYSVGQFGRVAALRAVLVSRRTPVRVTELIRYQPGRRLPGIPRETDTGVVHQNVEPPNSAATVDHARGIPCELRVARVRRSIQTAARRAIGASPQSIPPVIAGSRSVLRRPCPMLRYGGILRLITPGRMLDETVGYHRVGRRIGRRRISLLPADAERYYDTTAQGPAEIIGHAWCCTSNTR